MLDGYDIIDMYKIFCNKDRTVEQISSVESLRLRIFYRTNRFAQQEESRELSKKIISVSINTSLRRDVDKINKKNH